jgi:hypothetical protein
VGDFAYALQAAGEGVVFRSLLPVKSETIPAALAIDHKNKTSRPLALIAMALLAAFADPGDGRPLREVVGKLAAAPSKGAGSYKTAWVNEVFLSKVDPASGV